MTVLRRRMIEDMQLRDPATRTQEACVVAVEQLADCYYDPPDEIGPRLTGLGRHLQTVELLLRCVCRCSRMHGAPAMSRNDFELSSAA